MMNRAPAPAKFCDCAKYKYDPSNIVDRRALTIAGPKHQPVKGS